MSARPDNTRSGVEIDSAHRPANSLVKTTAHKRLWHASLDLAIEQRQQKSVIVNNSHVGPLRVQRPFYPERDGSAHVYLLHPPGGMVVGDRLDIRTHVGVGAKTLITTPSASKFYRVDNLPEPQIQCSVFNVEADAQLEWLPQETIVFEGANGVLETQFNLAADAKLCTWDVVVLGRPAAGEGFLAGRFTQNLRVNVNNRLRLLERNAFNAGCDLLTARYGLHCYSTLGTFIANVSCSQLQMDNLREELSTLDNPKLPALWGLTQKEEWLIIRYLGSCAEQAKNGFSHMWQHIRPIQMSKEATIPRIWYT